MGFYADTLAKIQAAITARLDGGTVESYSIDGQSIQSVQLEVLFRLEEKYADKALAELGGSRVSIARLRPQ
jgi:hypothetical protein